MTDAPKVYLVRAGRNGEDEDYALTHNLAIIGFQNVPSLEGAKGYDEGSRPREPGSYLTGSHVLSVISRDNSGPSRLAMREGDIVVLPRKLTSQVDHRPCDRTLQISAREH